MDLDYLELERLLGLDLHWKMERLDEILANVKGEVKLFNEQEGTVSIEMKDTNRPDLWSAEGLARGLRCYLGLEKGARLYTAEKPVVDVNVDAQLFDIRPFIACAVIKDVQLSDAVIRGLMHMQDKLDKTFGRNRQKTSIGIYNFHMIKPPIEYRAVNPSEVSFVPLGFDQKLTLNEILERHLKGLEYGHIVKKNPLYPMLYDSEGKILSFPPIINSNDLGKITEESRNLLVEVTGTVHRTVVDTLNLVAAALIDRGGKAFSATIHYPEGNGYKRMDESTPNFSSRTVPLSVEYTNRLLGLKLSAKQIGELLLTAGLGIGKTHGDTVDVVVPFYRVDVMHQVDLVEDVAVAFGYNNIECVWREMPTTGRAKPDQRQIDVARELLVGLGYQEILTYTLTDKETLFGKMNVKETACVEVANPKVATMTCLRNWLLPSLMGFLSNNQSVEFPQKIFELGKVTLLDELSETKTRDEEWVCAATTHANANFTEIKSALDAFFMNFGVQWQIKEAAHPSFIEGRVGAVLVGGVEVGFVGEINPAVLEAWKLENPVAAFEIDLQKAYKINIMK
ncbi:MAG: phenylalanine--tRNA ligase subunit beta [Candidatus Bathyarchaeia archaeon]